MNDRIPLVDPMKAGAFRVVIINHPASLQMGIDRDGADVLEAALFQILADPVGQAVTDRNAAFGMAFINDGFPIRICPQVIAKAAEFLAHLSCLSGELFVSA